MRFAVFFLLLSIPVRADQLVLPHPLSNNTVADAEAVQANFSILIAESNENDLRLGAIEGVLGFDASLENTVVGNGLQANNPDLSFSEYSGGYSTAIGYDALLSNTKGWSNTAVGAWSLLSNTEGYRNTALGTVTLSSNIEGDGNVAVGFNALYYNKSGSYNTAVGYESLVNNLTGRNNTAIGVAALAYNTEGNSNTGLGDFALYNNVSAGYNTAIGRDSLHGNTSGEGNTGAGYQSLYHNQTGSKNTAVGFRAMDGLASGSGNTALGWNADVWDVDNSTAIGARAVVQTDNTVQLGDVNVVSVVTAGKLTTGAVTYPNVDGDTGDVLRADGNGFARWDQDEDTLASISCTDGEVLRWNDAAWGCSTNTYALTVSELEEQVASLQEQLQSQQEELLAIVQSQQEQIAQLQRMVEHQFTMN